MHKPGIQTRLLIPLGSGWGMFTIFCPDADRLRVIFGRRKGEKLTAGWAEGYPLSVRTVRDRWYTAGHRN